MKLTSNWGVMAAALGASLFYLSALVIQLVLFHSFGSMFFVPFLLVLLTVGAVLGLLTELVGRIRWLGPLPSSILVPSLLTGISYTFYLLTPRAIFHWQDLMPSFLIGLFFVGTYWLLKKLFRNRYGEAW